MFAKLALSLFKQFVLHGTLAVAVGNRPARVLQGGVPGPTASIHIVYSQTLWRVVMKPDLAIGEAYMDGLITSNKLAELIELTVLHNDYVEQKMQMSIFGTLAQKLNHWRNSNSKSGSARNIA